MKMTTGDQQMAPSKKECQIWQNDDEIWFMFPINDACFLIARLGWVCTISFPIHYYWNHAMW
jgi:hypothetical protein